jgi:PTH1 family peptidyl-tRNA hydrolase
VKAVVGLGNPGPKYVATRHNAGFMVVEELSGRHGIGVRKPRGLSLAGAGEVFGEDLWLIKPQTSMNLSGEAVSEIIMSTGISLENMMIICDDIHLPAGCVRIRQSGGHGGHRGLLSVIRSVGTNEIPRLRVGVGRAKEDAPISDYVLSKTGTGEYQTLLKTVKTAADAVESWVSEGIASAMNRYNVKVKPTEEAQDYDKGG